MADRAVSLRPVTLLGGAVAALLIFLTLGTLGAVALRAEAGQGLSPADIAAIRFTLIQATLSAAISVALAIPTARALSRNRFPGRQLLITLLGAPFILPVIVAILGLLAIFGRSGVFNQLLTAIGMPGFSIYGLQGVLLAHVFFNLPLATRILLQGWSRIPEEHFRLAATLGFAPRDVYRHLERPMLRATLPGAFMVIFLICLTSFAVALTLGGGPRATTLELAIYQSFRFDFDLGRAALLALIQFALCLVATLISLGWTRPAGFGAGLDRTPGLWHPRTRLTRLIDVSTLTAVTLFLILPLATILRDGLPNVLTLPVTVWSAAANSILVALASVALMLCLALPLALYVAHLRQRPIWGRAVETTGYLTLAASPLVIGTGLFLLLFPIANPTALALPITALVNAVMSLPFALRILTPAIIETEQNYNRLADSLSLTGWPRFRWLILPRIRAPLGFSMGLTAALSMGDLGVLALFADPDTATLPLLLYRLMGSYRMDQAAGAALLLVALSLALFWLFDRGGRNAQV